AELSRKIGASGARQLCVDKVGRRTVVGRSSGATIPVMAASSACQFGPLTTRIEPLDEGSSMKLTTGDVDAADGRLGTAPEISLPVPNPTVILPGPDGMALSREIVTTWLGMPAIMATPSASLMIDEGIAERSSAGTTMLNSVIP